jgi:hypothetical protein
MRPNLWGVIFNLRNLLDLVDLVTDCWSVVGIAFYIGFLMWDLACAHFVGFTYRLMRSMSCGLHHSLEHGTGGLTYFGLSILICTSASGFAKVLILKQVLPLTHSILSITSHQFTCTKWTPAWWQIVTWLCRKAVTHLNTSALTTVILDIKL